MQISKIAVKLLPCRTTNLFSYYSYLEALKEPDINYISVKISGIYAQTHALNYEESFPELVRRMSELYQAAIVLVPR